MFQACYPGNYYIIPKRLSQDVVESFFSVQRQSCGGSNNMTAYTYGYNINSTLASSIKLLSKKQTNVYETDDVDLGLQPQPSLPRRVNVEGILHTNLWPVHLWLSCCSFRGQCDEGNCLFTFNFSLRLFKNLIYI